MRKVLLPALTALSLVPAGLAFAAPTGVPAGEKWVYGEVKAVDPAHRTITLDDGEVFRLGPGVAAGQVWQGGNAIVAYEPAKGTPIAEAVTEGNYSLRDVDQVNQGF